MPHVHDRVRDTTTTTGNGNITLSGTPPAGFQAFSPVMNLNETFPYCIDAQTGTEWETGIGHLSGATTFVRDNVWESSNSGALVNFSAGTKDVFITAHGRLLNATSRGAVLARVNGLDFNMNY